MAKINNTKTTGAGEDVVKGELFALLVRRQTGTAPLENSMEAPQKVKMGGGTKNRSTKKKKQKKPNQPQKYIITQQFHFWEFTQGEQKH